jgi:eukaryotic-like serine/threonine-protein kinase
VALSATLLGGRYELDEPIGTGGFSEVWRATDTVLSRPVAIKLLHARYVRQAEALARFQAEARHAGALSHPNIARIYDYAEPADGQPYLVMELVDGPSLARVLRGGPLDAARTMDVVAQAAAGLQAAHDAGLIHRDIKPANLLLSPGGTVKITDFGIAHAVGSAPVTVTGMLIGTPCYMAPERVAGAQATSASDLYALGVVAYECLAGAPPFSGVPLEVALAHRERPLPPLPLSVPAEVGALVMQLTAKDAVWRPGSAAEVARRAAALRDGLRPAAAGVRPAPRAAAGVRPVRQAAPAAALAEAPVTMEDGGRPVLARTSRGRRLRLPSVLAATCVVLAGLAGLSLAGVLGFAPTVHQAGAPALSSAGPSQGSPPPARHHAARTRTATGPAAGPAAVPASVANQAAVTAGHPGRKQSHPGHEYRHKAGHGNDQGKGNGPGKGSGPGKGGGNGNGSGKGNASGQGSAQAFGG